MAYHSDVRWQLVDHCDGAGDRIYGVSPHMRIEEGADAEKILETAHARLKSQFGFFFATLQIETTCLDERDARSVDLKFISETPHGTHS